MKRLVLRFVLPIAGLLLSGAAHAEIVRWDFSGTVYGPDPNSGAFCDPPAPLTSLCRAMTNVGFRGSWIFESSTPDVSINLDGPAYTTTRTWRTDGALTLFVDDALAIYYSGDLFMQSVVRGDIAGGSYFSFGLGSSNSAFPSPIPALDLIDGRVIDVTFRGFLRYDISSPPVMSLFDATQPPPVDHSVSRFQFTPEISVGGIAGAGGMDFDLESWEVVPIAEPSGTGLCIGALALIIGWRACGRGARDSEGHGCDRARDLTSAP